MRHLKSLSICVSIFCLVIFALNYILSPHLPSDAALERQFNKNRVALEMLVSMMHEDSQMSRIAPNFVLVSEGSAKRKIPEISQQRWNDYKEIFKTVGLKGGLLQGPNSNDIEMIVYSWGLVTGGISKGFVFCDVESPKNYYRKPSCKEDKAEGQRLESKSKFRYKRVAPNWFIYEEAD